MEKLNKFIATQTDKGFQVVFNDSDKSPLELSFEDINKFGYKYSQAQIAGKELDLTEKDELILSIWEMILIPDEAIH